MTDESRYDPPKPTSGDTAHLVARAVLSTIPGAAELFEYIVSPPLERRRQEWMEMVGEALGELIENRGILEQALQENEVFIDTVLHASQIALRNSQEEKRQALKNAVLNAVLPNPPAKSEQQMFLNLVDVFTVWHLRLLNLFDDPRRWAAQNDRKLQDNVAMGSPANTLLSKAYPELASRRDFYDQVWKELDQRGLVNLNSLHATMTSDGIFSSRTTGRGKRFLKFIQEPDV